MFKFVPLASAHALAALNLKANHKFARLGIYCSWPDNVLGRGFLVYNKATWRGGSITFTNTVFFSHLVGGPYRKPETL